MEKIDEKIRWKTSSKVFHLLDHIFAILSAARFPSLLLYLIIAPLKLHKSSLQVLGTGRIRLLHVISFLRYFIRGSASTWMARYGKSRCWARSRPSLRSSASVIRLLVTYQKKNASCDWNLLTETSNPCALAVSDHSS